jgi:UDP-N-acetylmuramate dehydrogenase
MRIEENKPLAPLTTLGIGGPARWYVQAQDEDDIVEAAAWAREKGIPLFVLGGGSNLLVADAGFNGLVLHIGLKGISALESAGSLNERLYQVAAGEDWDHFVQQTVDDDCAGIECLAGIPGTVGGTPVQNVGAYGQEVSTTIDRVRAFYLQKPAFADFSASECAFAYRQSRFNTTDRGRYVVTRVDYRLTVHGAATLKYPDMQKAFEEGGAPRLRDVADTVRRVRQSKGMFLVEGDTDCHSAGSFFKNPIVSTDQAAAVTVAAGAEPPRFPTGHGNEDRVKLPAAWLIEKAGFTKGYVLGRAGISTKHTLALVNRGGSTAAEIIALASKIREAVLKQFEIQLQIEPVMLGVENF